MITEPLLCPIAAPCFHQDFLGSGLLTQVQAARACVLAHPYFLDGEQAARRSHAW